MHNMQLSFVEKNGLTVAVIDNFYPDDLLKIVVDEILFLKNPKILSLFSNHAVAVDDDTLQPLQKSASLFVDEFFAKNRKASAILHANRMLFLEKIYTLIESKSAFFRHVRNANTDTTLLNFYSVGDEYKPHRDLSVLTALTFFNIENVTGGDLYFPEYDVTIGPTHNRLVLFPGCVLHQSMPVTSGMKVSMAQFLGYK